MHYDEDQRFRNRRSIVFFDREATKSRRSTFRIATATGVVTEAVTEATEAVVEATVVAAAIAAVARPSRRRRW